MFFPRLYTLDYPRHKFFIINYVAKLFSKPKL